MPLIIQCRFTDRKKYSLVLKSLRGHHGGMTEPTTRHSHQPSRSAKVRTFLKYVWGDSVAAHRAMLRVPPYDDYLFNHRDER